MSIPCGQKPSRRQGASLLDFLAAPIQSSIHNSRCLLKHDALLIMFCMAELTGSVGNRASCSSCVAQMAAEVLYAMLGRDREVRASVAASGGLQQLMDLTEVCMACVPPIRDGSLILSSKWSLGTKANSSLPWRRCRDSQHATTKEQVGNPYSSDAASSLPFLDSP